MKAKIAASKAKVGAKKKGETSDAHPALKGTVTATSPAVADPKPPKSAEASSP
jgi:hypothetical protein